VAAIEVQFASRAFGIASLRPSDLEEIHVHAELGHAEPYLTLRRRQRRAERQFGIDGHFGRVAGAGGLALRVAYPRVDVEDLVLSKRATFASGESKLPFTDTELHPRLRGITGDRPCRTVVLLPVPA